MDDSVSFGASIDFSEALAVDVIDLGGLEPGGEPFVTSTERFLAAGLGSSSFHMGHATLGQEIDEFVGRLIGGTLAESMEDPVERMGGSRILGLGDWLDLVERVAAPAAGAYTWADALEPFFLPVELDDEPEGPASLWAETRRKEQEAAALAAAQASAAPWTLFAGDREAAAEQRDRRRAARDQQPPHAASRAAAQQQILEERARLRVERSEAEQERRTLAQRQRDELRAERAEAARIQDEAQRSQRLAVLEERGREQAARIELQRSDALQRAVEQERQRDEARQRSVLRSRLARAARVAAGLDQREVLAQLGALSAAVADETGALPPLSAVEDTARRVEQVRSQLLAAQAQTESRSLAQQRTRAAAQTAVAELDRQASGLADPELLAALERLRLQTAPTAQSLPDSGQLRSLAQRIQAARRRLESEQQQQETHEFEEQHRAAALQSALDRHAAEEYRAQQQLLRSRLRSLATSARSLRAPELQRWAASLASLATSARPEQLTREQVDGAAARLSEAQQQAQQAALRARSGSPSGPADLLPSALEKLSPPERRQLLERVRQERSQLGASPSLALRHLIRGFELAQPGASALGRPKLVEQLSERLRAAALDPAPGRPQLAAPARERKVATQARVAPAELLRLPEGLRPLAEMGLLSPTALTALRAGGGAGIRQQLRTASAAQDPSLVTWSRLSAMGVSEWMPWAADDGQPPRGNDVWRSVRQLLPGDSSAPRSVAPPKPGAAGAPPAPNGAALAGELPALFAAQPDLLADLPRQLAAQPELATRLSSALLASPGGRAWLPQLLASSPALAARLPQLLAEQPGLADSIPAELLGAPDLAARLPQLIAGSPSLAARLPEFLAAQPALASQLWASSELSARLPQLVASSPELAAALPQLLLSSPRLAATALPGLFAATPQIVAALPWLVSQSPALAERLPELLGAAPSLAASLPQVLAATPSLAARIPELLGSFPELRARLPELLAAAPSLARRLPSLLAAAPQWAQRLPELIAAAPALADRLPELLAGQSGVAARLPALLAAAPQWAERIPELLSPSELAAHLPKLLAASPEVAAALPRIVTRAPALSARLPQLVASSPAVAARLPELLAVSPDLVAALPNLLQTVPGLARRFPALAARVAPSAERQRAQRAGASEQVPVALRGMLPAGLPLAALGSPTRLSGPGAGRRPAAVGAAPLPEVSRWFRWQDSDEAATADYLRWTDWTARPQSGLEGVASERDQPLAALLQQEPALERALRAVLRPEQLRLSLDELPPAQQRAVVAALEGPVARADLLRASVARLPGGAGHAGFRAETFATGGTEVAAPGAAGRAAAEFRPKAREEFQRALPAAARASLSFLPAGMVSNLLSPASATLLGEIEADLRPWLAKGPLSAAELASGAQQGAQALAERVVGALGGVERLLQSGALAESPAAAESLLNEIAAVYSPGLAAALAPMLRRLAAGQAEASGAGARTERFHAALPSLGFLGFSALPELANSLDRRWEAGLLHLEAAGLSSASSFDLLARGGSRELLGALVKLGEGGGARALAAALGYTPGPAAGAPQAPVLAEIQRSLARAGLPGALSERVARAAGAPEQDGAATARALSAWLQTELAQPGPQGLRRVEAALRALDGNPQTAALLGQAEWRSALQRRVAGGAPEIGGLSAATLARLESGALRGSDAPAELLHQLGLGGLAADQLAALPGTALRDVAKLVTAGGGERVPGLLSRWLSPADAAGAPAALSERVLARAERYGETSTTPGAASAPAAERRRSRAAAPGLLVAAEALESLSTGGPSPVLPLSGAGSSAADADAGGQDVPVVELAGRVLPASTAHRLLAMFPAGVPEAVIQRVAQRHPTGLPSDAALERIVAEVATAGSVPLGRAAARAQQDAVAAQLSTRAGVGAKAELQMLRAAFEQVGRGILAALQQAPQSWVSAGLSRDLVSTAVGGESDSVRIVLDRMMGTAWRDYAGSLADDLASDRDPSSAWANAWSSEMALTGPAPLGAGAVAKAREAQDRARRAGAAAAQRSSEARRQAAAQQQRMAHRKSHLQRTVELAEALFPQAASMGQFSGAPADRMAFPGVLEHSEAVDLTLVAPMAQEIDLHANPLYSKEAQDKHQAGTDPESKRALTVQDKPAKLDKYLAPEQILLLATRLMREVEADLQDANDLRGIGPA